MQQLDLAKLVPWNLGAVHPIFLGEMSVNPKTFQNLTFSEVCSMQKSPTLGVTEEHMKSMAKKTNKLLKISSYASSSKPLRPDLSDIEIALIHSTWGNIPVSHMAETLNITEVRLKQIRKATEHLYKQANTPLPSLPLITITDTSRYWTDEEVIDTYGDLDPKLTEGLSNYVSKPSDILEYKDLLRSLKQQSKDLNFPINAKLYSSEDNKDSVFTRASIPSEVPWQDKEGYSKLSDILWTYVSREAGVSGELLKVDGNPNNSVDLPNDAEDSTLNKGKYSETLGLLYFYDWNPENSIVQVPIEYKSSIITDGKPKVIDHIHTIGGYNPPLNIPKTLIRLCVDIINEFISSNMEAPSLENLTLHLMSSLEYTSKRMGVNLKPLSSNRGHCLPLRSKKPKVPLLNKGKYSGALNYIINTPPLVYLKFASKYYNYGVICHECDSFLSNNTVNECKHLKFSIKSTTLGAFEASNQRIKPLIYLYHPESAPNYSLYYYNLDEYGSIYSIFTLNLLQFYTNFSIPVHKVPFEA